MMWGVSKLAFYGVPSLAASTALLSVKRTLSRAVEAAREGTP